MDTRFLERIRSPDFPLARRGYERRDVHNFLLSVAEWLEHGGHDEAEEFGVQRELERAGEVTARVLVTAHAEADRMLKQASSEARRRESESIAAARQRMVVATTRARAIVEEAEGRRKALDAQIRELSERRDRLNVETRDARDRERERERAAG